MFPDITNFARVIGTDIGNFGTEWSGNAPYPSPLPWHQPIGAKTTILTPTAANVPQIQANADKVVAAKAPSAGAGAGASASGAGAGASASGAGAGASASGAGAGASASGAGASGAAASGASASGAGAGASASASGAGASN